MLPWTFVVPMIFSAEWQRLLFDVAFESRTFWLEMYVCIWFARYRLIDSEVLVSLYFLAGEKTHKQITPRSNLAISWCFKWITFSTQVSYQFLFAMFFPSWFGSTTRAPMMQSWLSNAGLGRLGFPILKAWSWWWRLHPGWGGVDVTHPPLLVVYICHRPSSLERLHCLAWRVHLQLKASGWESPFDLSVFWTKTRGQTRLLLSIWSKELKHMPSTSIPGGNFSQGRPFLTFWMAVFFLKTSEVADRWEGFLNTKWSCWYFF